MGAKQVLPRLIVILIFMVGALFAYIESVYMRDHAETLGAKGTTVFTWMWIYRVISMALLLASSFIAGGFWRR